MGYHEDQRVLLLGTASATIGAGIPARGTTPPRAGTGAGAGAGAGAIGKKGAAMGAVIPLTEAYPAGANVPTGIGVFNVACVAGNAIA